MLLYLFIFLLNIMIILPYNIVPISPTKYVSYSRVKNIFLEIYDLKKNSNYTIEHVVPQSKLKKNKYLKSDMHNLFYYPTLMNIHRSNYKYVSDFKFYEKSLLLDDKGNNIPHEYQINLNKEKMCIKTANRQLFLPCGKYRGEIARASMYFICTYPDFKDTVLNEVIDPYTILTWHHEYPVNDFEIQKNEKIFEYQGNQNIFVLDPSLLTKYMEEILNIELLFYKKYFFNL